MTIRIEKKEREKFCEHNGIERKSKGGFAKYERSEWKDTGDEAEKKGS